MKEVIGKAINDIPDNSDIIKETFESLKIRDIPPEDIINNFGKYVLEVQDFAHKLYKDYQNSAFKYVSDEWMKKRKSELKKCCEVSDIESFKQLNYEFALYSGDLEFRLGQSRRRRGGTAFELIILKLLNISGVPCEQPPQGTGLKNIDIIAPDASCGLEDPEKALFISAKRTLRERWKQIVQEHIDGTTLYVVTIDERLTENTAKNFKKDGLIAYVRDELKEETHLNHMPWIRPLSDLPFDAKTHIQGYQKRQMTLG